MSTIQKTERKVMYKENIKFITNSENRHPVVQWTGI